MDFYLEDKENIPPSSPDYRPTAPMRGSPPASPVAPLIKLESPEQIEAAVKLENIVPDTKETIRYHSYGLFKTMGHIIYILPSIIKTIHS